MEEFSSTVKGPSLTKSNWVQPTQKMGIGSPVFRTFLFTPNPITLDIEKCSGKTEEEYKVVGYIDS